MKHVIVGDGVAGHTAAATIRDRDPDADIHVLTREPVPFYDRIGLRDYVRGGRTRDELVLSGEDWYAEHDIRLHLDTAVETIDRDAQQVVTTDGERYGYDRLLLATGSTPRVLDMEQGVDHVHHLWELERHGEALKRDLARADDGVVIGGGLLGFDLVGSFVGADVDTTYLIREENWWHSVLAPDGAAIVHDAMRDAGIAVRTGEEATDLATDGDRVRVPTEEDDHAADVVGVAVGNVPNIDLAADAGLETDRGIVCDDHLRTADPHIHAAGDVAAYRDVVLDRRHRCGSWVTAQKQGEVAGANMAGDETALEFVDTYTVSHFGLNVASVGDPVSRDGREVVTALDRDGGAYRKVVLEDGRIVGAAIVGEMRWMHPLKQLILNAVDVSGAADDLADPGFDPSDLL